MGDEIVEVKQSKRTRITRRIFLAGSLLLNSYFIATSKENPEKMSPKEAADIIRGIAKSLQENPTQFQINVNVSATGQQITSYGGTGQSVNVTCGGPGSSTTGVRVSVSMDDAKISTARAQGN